MQNKLSTLPALKSHLDIKERYRTDQVICSIIQSEFKHNSSPVLIAIGGPGGTGKTTFAHRLKEILKNSAVLSLDNYKTSRQHRNQRNIFGPHPEANMIHLIIEHLTSLKSGQSVSVPIYDRTTGDTGSYNEFTPEKYIIVEGEVSTYPEFHHLFDLSIFIDADLKTQLTTRVRRDIEQYGFSYEKAVTVFLNSNLREFIQFGAESKSWSDITCYCHDDYEISLTAVSERLFLVLESLSENIKSITVNGLIVPVPTPFTKDFHVDQQAFINHLEWLYRQGVKKILVGGTTAEFFSLTMDERVTICSLACRYFPGTILFQIGCDGIGNTQMLLERSLRYGIDGVFCLPPYYYSNAPTQGLVEYFSFLSSRCTVPFFLYNFVTHSGNKITKEILCQVAHSGLKDSSDSLDLAAHTPIYFTGNEKNIVETYALGGQGFICGFPNVSPRIYLELENALSINNRAVAETLLTKITSFKRSIPGISGISIIKALLSTLIEGYLPVVRPPMVQADTHPEFVKIKELFTKFI
ncbi:MAG TPA: dihydrodipicolinate synthase family protein [Chitinispirillaceae bacterium]|nr:dihydrodipicolinate synthase family protein [Chitinispirillaceae bacterium]